MKFGLGLAKGLHPLLNLPDKTARSAVQGQTSVGTQLFPAIRLGSELPSGLGTHDLQRSALLLGLLERGNRHPGLGRVVLRELGQHLQIAVCLFPVAGLQGFCDTTAILGNPQLVLGRIAIDDLIAHLAHGLQLVLGNTGFREGTQIGALLVGQIVIDVVGQPGCCLGRNSIRVSHRKVDHRGNGLLGTGALIRIPGVGIRGFHQSIHIFGLGFDHLAQPILDLANVLDLAIQRSNLGFQLLGPLTIGFDIRDLCLQELGLFGISFSG